MITACDLDYK